MALATSFPTGTGGCLTPRYGFLVAAGAPPPLHPVVVVQAAPSRSRFGACKAGRLVLVAAAATTPAPGPEGGDDNKLPSGEEVASDFRSEIKAFQLSYRPVILLGMPSEMTVEVAYGTAMDCTPMLEFLLAKETVDPDILEGLVLAGKAFLTIEHQAKQGYLEAEPLINGIQGMKLIGSVFFKDKGELDYKVPVVPADEADIHKESFFRELVKLFVMHRSAVYAEATNKYSFGTRGAYDDLLTADKELAVPESRMETVAKFCKEMDAFKASHRAATLLGYHLDSTTTYALEMASRYAQDTFGLLDLLFPESTRTPKELIAAAKALLTVVIQAERQYMEEDALRNGIKALDMIGKMLFDVDLSVHRPLQPPPPDAETRAFFACLIENFNRKTAFLHRLARNKYIWFYPRI